MTSQLKYPKFDIKLKKENGEVLVFDTIRKNWFVCTPEEWVRQHVINFLIVVKKYPVSLFAIEKEIVLNDLKRRFDVVVYSTNLKPLVLIECKAMYIEINEAVAEQAMRYNLVLNAPYFMLTNGVVDFVFHENKLSDLPQFC
ncbi:MAG: type I restriction enzyme HsdR N-terminal domain-containing protein [Bacteroidetes bacterium]|nr:type I restriction enzyme HsdR N-terminal domain-containing protein [Bacteroidota bacterium]